MKQEMYHYFNLLEETHWWFLARKEIVLRLIHKFQQREKESSPPHILDIGCGTGGMLTALQSLGTVWGIDSSKKAVDYASSKVPKATITQGSVPQDMPQQQFDIITLLDVLEHIEDDTAALQKIKQSLKPRGIAVITVPALQFLWTSHDDMNEHKRRYSRRELKEKIEKSGLILKKISYYNTLLFLPIAAIKILQRLFPLKKKSHFRDTPPPAFLNIPLRIIFGLEKYLLSSLNFPFGISIIAVVQHEK